MKRILTICFLLSLFSSLAAQKKVSFLTEDGIMVTADLYLKGTSFPFIILFHQAGYSRGEFREIAPRLLNLDYNCLAVDLRVGDKVNFVTNETARELQKKGISATFLDARKDILASIEFVKRYSRQPLVLFGSSYSASLSLLVASENNQVKAVVAFSPGEYFRPQLNLRDEIKNLKKPLFITATDLEFSYLEDTFTGLSEQKTVYFRPTREEGVHGAKALWDSNPSSKDYWLALSTFFSKLKVY